MQSRHCHCKRHSTSMCCQEPRGDRDSSNLYCQRPEVISTGLRCVRSADNTKKIRQTLHCCIGKHAIHRSMHKKNVTERRSLKQQDHYQRPTGFRWRAYLSTRCGQGRGRPGRCRATSSPRRRSGQSCGGGPGGPGRAPPL